MLYRVHVLLAFTSQHPALDIINKALPHLPAAVTINPGQPNEEKGYIITEQCFHDDDPTKPCIVIEEYWTH